MLYWLFLLLDFASRQTVRLLFKDARCLLSCLHNAELGLPVVLISDLLYGHKFYFFRFILLFPGYTSWQLPAYLHKRLNIIEAAMTLIANKLITSNVILFVTLTLNTYFHLHLKCVFTFWWIMSSWFWIFKGKCIAS